MAIVQISRIQHRRGYQQDLPQLASAELGWSIDTRKLYIGNGALEEGAPELGVTEILTQHSDILGDAQFYTYKGQDSGQIAQTGPDLAHPTYRTLQAKLDDVVSVKDFGAKGDGVTDDTAAIQRALDYAFATAQAGTDAPYKRSVLIPAGTYRVTSTINVPPYSKLQGEGKRSSFIQGDFLGPLIQLKDSFGQTGTDYFKPNIFGSNPYNVEYHFNDLCVFNLNTTTRNGNCVLIDGGFGVYFNRCAFSGTKYFASGDGYPSDSCFDIEQSSGVSLVNLRDGSYYDYVRDIVFNQCDFEYHNYGLEINNGVRGVTVHDCFFGTVNKGIIIGNNIVDPNYVPYAISIGHCWFQWIAAEGIKTYSACQGIISGSNWFTSVGLGDYFALTPLSNPAGIPLTPVITFGADNCYSVADVIGRNQADYAAAPTIPNIQDNGYTTYSLSQDRGLVLGRTTVGTGLTKTLSTAGSWTNANLSNVPLGYSNLTINYTANTAVAQRTGTLRISQFAGSYVLDDEYTETSDIGLTLNANTTTGNIEYTSFGNVTISYSLNYITR